MVQAVAEGIGPGALTVDQVMTPEIARVPEWADAHEAMVAMRELSVCRIAWLAAYVRLAPAPADVSSR